METLLAAIYQFSTAFFIETFVRVFNVKFRNVLINEDHLPQLQILVTVLRVPGDSYHLILSFINVGTSTLTHFIL